MFLDKYMRWANARQRPGGYFVDPGSSYSPNLFMFRCSLLATPRCNRLACLLSGSGCRFAPLLCHFRHRKERVVRLMRLPEDCRLYWFQTVGTALYALIEIGSGKRIGEYPETLWAEDKTGRSVRTVYGQSLYPDWRRGTIRIQIRRVREVIFHYRRPRRYQSLDRLTLLAPFDHSIGYLSPGG
jgi:hypothetical protein